MWILQFIPWWTPLAVVIAAGVVYWLQPHLKLGALATLASALYLQGVLHLDRAWRAKTQELEAKVQEIAQQSQKTNVVIEQRVVTKREYYRLQAAESTKYIDREVTKHDSGCVIPPEFVAAHNKGATP